MAVTLIPLYRILAAPDKEWTKNMMDVESFAQWRRGGRGEEGRGD
jgi:hypothetical protein